MTMEKAQLKNKNSRRSFIKSAGVSGIAGALIATQSTASAAAIADSSIVRWRLASSFPKTLDTIYGSAEVFAKQVEIMSEGKFIISVHSGGELVPPFGVFDAVSQGSVEAGATAGYYYFGKNDALALDAAVPFGLNTRQMNAWMFDGNGLSLLRELFAGYNIINFPIGNTGAQMGGWYKKDISSIASLQGLKIRVGGFAGKVLKMLGAVPQNLPGGELYQALEKGIIDGAEWVGPYDDLKLGLHKVTSHYLYPAWWEGSTQLSLYINKNAFMKLPKSYQQIVEVASAFAHIDMTAKYDARNPDALKEIIAKGTITKLTPKPIMDAAYQASLELYASIAKSNPQWKKIYTDYQKFQKNTVSWFKYAEHGFDSYMQNKL
ncbi:MAG: TRAP transporter substrate-binding protein DctP [Methylacidiphilales bacterium]|nr:TRAP transporter substrate-binding protein DctP [Candidatus Methylacidiphilales bacterium]